MNFDDFLDTELEQLGRYARVLTGDRQSAHDLLGDILVTASTRWVHISQIDHPAAYVRRMLTNRYIDLTRRSRRFIWSKTASDFAEIVEPYDPIHNAQQRSFLDELLRNLPARQRAALVLRYYLHLTDEEIASELKITTGSVRSIISRGLASLRNITTLDDVRTFLL